MTNKINGIDVSECEFLECGMCNAQRNCDGYTGIECKYDNENCYYRQLKRTIQINSELISKANAYDKLVILANDRLDIIDRLKQENEELKKQLEFSRTHKTVLDAERIKYKQALEEIRNIAEKLITETPEYHSCYYKDECGDNCTPKKQSKVEYCCYENVDKILTIINEVLNDRNKGDIE